MQTGYLKDRRVSDAAGIIPFVIGSIKQAPLQGRGLYIDQPLLRYTPPKVDLKTGAYASRVAETAAVVKAALEKAKIELIDSVRSVSGEESYTPLAKILAAFKKYELKMVEFVSTHKAKLANNNAVISTMIIDNLRKAAKGEEEPADFKRRLQGILKQGKEMTEDSLGDTLLDSDWHLQNEDFSGLDEFDHFYETYIFTKDNREAFKKLKNTMDTNSLTAFVYVVKMYHAYYDTFLDGTSLNATTPQTIDKLWRDTAFPPKPEASEKCVDDSDHEKKANSIVNGLVWDILLERFEIFASIVDHVFKELAGSGSEQVKHSADEFIRVGVIAAMDHLFVTKSGNRTRDEIAGATYKDGVSLIIQEVVVIHDKFEAAIGNFLHEDWIVQFEPTSDVLAKLSESKVDVASADQGALGKRIALGLFNSEVPSGAKLSVKDSKVVDLSIDSTVSLLSQAVKQIFATLTKDKPKSLLITNEGRSSITHFKRTQERDNLKEFIIKKMAEKAGTSAQNILEVFAAKVITALYNQDPYFAALFLLPAGSSKDRSNLALKTLHKLGSVFSNQSTVIFAEADAKSINFLSIPTGDPTAASVFITEATTYKDKFKLSPELKKAYDKALTRAANTNKGPKQQPKKAAAAPQQENQAQKQKQKQQPQQGQKKGNQRPQSAPPPQKPNNKGGKGKNRGGRGGGR